LVGSPPNVVTASAFQSENDVGSPAVVPAVAVDVIIGAVLLASLATGFSERIISNPDVPPAARDTIVANTQEGIDIVPVATVEQAAVEGGLTPDQARSVADNYGEAQLDALRLSLGAVALAALLSLWLTRRLPTRSLAESEVAATEPTAMT